MFTGTVEVGLTLVPGVNVQTALVMPRVHATVTV
jgi:hypothetical protein